MSEKKSSIQRSLSDLDVHLTHTIAVCSSGNHSNVLFNYLRYILILLEFSFHGVPWFALVLYLLATGHATYAAVLKPLLFGLILDIIVIALVKMIFKRKRPVLNKDDMLATGGPDKYSFPSGHSSRAIMTTMLLVNFLDLNTNQTFVLISWSYLTCLSRLLLARHHVSDVVVGILLGYLFYYLTAVFY